MRYPHRIEVALTEMLWRDVTTMAKDRGISTSEMIRYFLARSVRQEKGYQEKRRKKEAGYVAAGNVTAMETGWLQGKAPAHAD